MSSAYSSSHLTKMKVLFKGKISSYQVLFDNNDLNDYIFSVNLIDLHLTISLPLINRRCEGTSIHHVNNPHNAKFSIFYSKYFYHKPTTRKSQTFIHHTNNPHNAKISNFYSKDFPCRTAKM